MKRWDMTALLFIGYCLAASIESWEAAAIWGGGCLYFLLTDRR